MLSLQKLFLLTLLGLILQSFTPGRAFTRADSDDDDDDSDVKVVEEKNRTYTLDEAQSAAKSRDN